MYFFMYKLFQSQLEEWHIFELNIFSLYPYSPICDPNPPTKVWQDSLKPRQIFNFVLLFLDKVLN